MDCPRLLRTLVVGDDPKLLAQISCLIARKGSYLPVVDGPRMTRPDYSAEVVVRGNAAARLMAKLVLFAGLPLEASALFSRQIPETVSKRIETVADVERMAKLTRPLKGKPLVWGRDRIGCGLLLALQQQRSIEFTDAPSPTAVVSGRSGHWVVCESGDDHAQVVAANYAYALDAGLCLIPEIERRQAEDILETFYSIYELEESPGAALERLNGRLRRLVVGLPVGTVKSATFITNFLPLGAAFPEFPSSHLAMYPQLGVTVVNGFAAELDDGQALGCAVLVDPQKTEAPEIAAATQLLRERQVFLRSHVGPAANVLHVSQMVELYPYDLLVIATHCGDASGWRWTYEFEDSNGKMRRLEVDTAIGVASSDRDDDKLLITQLYNFTSLDGVSWHDPDRDSKLVVGPAIIDFQRRMDKLEPTSKVPINRVHRSAVLQMFDNNYLPIPRSIAGHRNPVILNNACASWHRLAETFMLGGARAYVGTLYPVTAYDAEPVTTKLFGKHFGKPLPVALWAAQRDAYQGSSPRRPYVMAGIFPQRLRVVPRDVPALATKALLTDARKYRQRLTEDMSLSQESRDAIQGSIAYLEREAQRLYARWLAPRRRAGSRRPSV